ncbi:phage holin family protein [Burkholderia cenocepacia]|uniref:phage holin family protein n=1 Tax=Burkholderia cenocepacia TaxID=95486 RepID=UPI0022383EE5|nr:phage holin family protein [Burkholderia cenocepacia]MCW5141052.1 phage holin family protein [Burkholderia cenocepacia]
MTTESELWKLWKEVGGLAAIGGVIAFGKLMAEPERPKLRIVIGRTIVGSGLSVAAGAALTLFPDLPPLAVTGIGACFGILGQQYLELLAMRAVNRRRRPDIAEVDTAAVD